MNALSAIVAPHRSHDASPAWRCLLITLGLLLVPTVARAGTGILRADTTTPLVGTPVTFTADQVPRVDVTVLINFGDGSPVTVLGPSYPATITHSYHAIGEYFATLSGTSIGRVILPIRVVLPAPRVPHGIIFSTVPLVSPVLAGDQTSITVTYRVMTPDTGFVSNAPDLAAVVDLLDEHDRLIARGDPVVIPYATYVGGAVQTAHIPYTVPSDARGRYRLRVYLRTPDLGGTVAAGDAAQLTVVGGPDPAPQVSAAIHASGSIEVGPSTGIGSTAGTSPSGQAQTTLNANLALGLINTGYTFTGATTLNPTSRRIDPLFTLLPGMQNVVSPNAQQVATVGASAAATPAPHYEDMLGPVTAPLPSLLFAGGESLRGLYSIVNTGGWQYQAALGYPTIASSTLGGQAGYLLNFARPFSASQDLHLTFLQNVDDPYTFVPTNGNAAVNSRAGGLEFDQQFDQHFTLAIGAANSGATPELKGGPTQSDAADKAQLSFTSGADSVNIEYHNFGANFSAGNGLGATSDSAGASAQGNFALSQLASLAVNFAHEFKRTAGYGDSQAGATLNLATPQGFQISFTSGNDHTLAATSDSITRNYNLTLGKNGTISSLTLNGSLATVSDSLNPGSNGVTRTGALAYSVTHGPATIALGVNATGNQIGSPSASVAESAVVSFPLGIGRANQASPAGATGFSAARGFEVQLTGSNTNQTGETSDTRDAILGALLSYHFGPHLTLGLHALADRHTDILVPANTGTAKMLRVRMDLML